MARRTTLFRRSGADLPPAGAERPGTARRGTGGAEGAPQARRTAGRTTRRASAAAATGAVLALSLTGCLGGSGDDPVRGAGDTTRLPANTVLVKASQRTGQADTFEADLTVTDGDTTIRGSGAVRLRPAPAFTATFDEVRVNGQTLPAAGSQVILLNDVLYAKVPQLAQMFTDGKPWLRMNLDQVSRRAGVDLDRITSAVQRINPAEQTAMLTASKDVRRVGEEKVEGVPTTRYTGTVTLQEALSRLDEQAREKVRRWHADGSERLAFDIWVDAENLPRKLVLKGTADGRENSTVTVLYRDFGEPVTVNAPPADQVGDVTDRLGRLPGGG
ncbi:hypothetical protein [Thermomonospora catenispora]|uniref:hypothetical protein n=1 Tax=Thermomonospora catenispora TaxID=2493090 RepID=UPI00111CF526|nr:hypothetical protein [Thermomonospora catenispora]TNY38840.1 hypothetical protein EIO00_01185 [Thermomonospora catenispora]